MMALSEQYPWAIVDSAAAFALEHMLYPGPKQFRELLDKIQSQQAPVVTPRVSEDSLEFVRDITYFISKETMQ
jgi:hypothetical protein